MSRTYAILGAGRQGVAAAYDLALRGGAGRILMVDARLRAAEEGAARVNRLTGRDVARAVLAEAGDPARLEILLRGCAGTLSAVPYRFNLGITRACLRAGSHLCDLGGNTQVVWSQLGFDADARTAGVSVVPDCGMGPGLINHMACYVMELLDSCQEVYLYDGGLPKRPVPPWNYQLGFHINGLTNEYDADATFIRDGRLVQVPTFTELEYLDIPPLGRLEAFVISGSLSTSPETHLGRLQRYETKVLRHPGHFHTFEAYKRLGLFSEAAVEVDGVPVVPRSFYHRLLEPQIVRPGLEDICVMRAVGVGEKDGRPATVTVDLVDEYDPATGFTAMERLTGWHAAAVLALQAGAMIPPGCHRAECALTGTAAMQEMARRGIPHRVSWS